MGKVKTRILGLEEVEKQQKEEQKEKAMQKKMAAQKETPEGEEGKEVSKEKKAEPKKSAKKEAVVKKAHVRGKKYAAAKTKVDKTKLFSVKDAVALLHSLAYAKFDESVELHLNVLESGLKGEVEFPHSTGKSVRIAIVSDALLIDLEKGKMNFDMLVTHPSFMPKLAKFAKVLGPKGLMPNPKAGTISPNPEEVVKKFEKGTTRWKTEAKFPLVHQMVGKISFDDKKLVENIEAFLTSVGKNNITSAYIKTTYSPSVKLNLQ